MKTLMAAACALLCAASASAQQDRPVGGFVVDLKGTFARHKQEPSVATDLEVIPANLPTHSFGLAGGAHVYPLHLGKVTFGFGGHVAAAGSSKTLEPGTTTTAGDTLETPTVRRHFRAYVSEISLNFGHRSGWSFISGGIGGASLYADRKDAPATGVPLRQTIHYGGGARWFTNHHMAVSLEFRWYSVAPLAASATYVAQPRTTLLVLSGGIALR
jgi:hypothetical protein